MISKLIVGNWKMYPTLADSLVLVSTLKRRLEDVKGIDVVLAPPSAWLVSVSEAWKQPLAHVTFAAQNIWPDDQGAFTGEVSAYMVKNIVKHAIIGHSERRRWAGEDDDLTHQKVQACLKWGIKPILCVGETKRMIDSTGKFDSYQLEKVAEQLLEGLASVKKDDFGKVTVAYEPVWAISSSDGAKAATAEYTLQVVNKLKEKLATKFSVASSEMVRFIYGGSVNPDNAGEFFRYPEIAGALVGSESVKAKDFLQICSLAAKIASK